MLVWDKHYILFRKTKYGFMSSIWRFDMKAEDVIYPIFKLCKINILEMEYEYFKIWKLLA